MLSLLLVALTWAPALPVNLQVADYHNVVCPNQAPEWNIRLQVQFLFPR